MKVNVNLNYILAFGAGALTGSLLAAYFTRKKMEEINERDIEDVKSHYEKMATYCPNPATFAIDGVPVDDVVFHDNADLNNLGNTVVSREETEQQPDAESISEPETLDTHATSYASYFSTPDPEIAEGEEQLKSKDRKDPYWIDLTEYGEKEGYSTASLLYYLDGYLCDEDDEPLEDPSRLVGDFKRYVTAYNEPIYIRNDKLCSDYEIIVMGCDRYPDGLES